MHKQCCVSLKQEKEKNGMEKRIRYAVQTEDLPGTVETLMRKRLGLSAHQIRSAKFRQEGITLNGVRTRITGCPVTKTF